jgi:hypothetical protein
MERGSVHHPYRDLPISPPYAVINAGPKCMGLDLNRVALDYHESETRDSQRELKHQLELLCDIWHFLSTQVLGGGKRERRRNRKREEDDMEIRLR